MAFTNVYDDTFPPDVQLASQGAADLRQVRVDVQERMAAISGLDAAKPNFNADAQPASWNGVLFFALDTAKVYKFVNPSWVDVTSTIIGNNSLSKFKNFTNPTQVALGTITLLTIPAASFNTTSHARLYVSTLSQGGGPNTIQLQINGVSITTGLQDRGIVVPGPFIPTIGIELDISFNSNTTATVCGVTQSFTGGVLGLLPQVVSGITVPDITVNSLLIQSNMTVFGAGLSFPAVALEVY